MASGYLARSFDLFNVRDLDLIAQAAALCRQLTLGVLTDESVRRLQGRPPVVPLHERLEIVRHLRGIHEVLVHDDGTFDRTAHSFTVFAASGEPQFVSDPSVVILTPHRETESWMLRDALRLAPETSVA